MYGIVQNFVIFWAVAQVNSLPTEISDGSGHKLIWKNGNISLDDQLKKDISKGDFFYLLTGDTQHFHACTYNNPRCLKQTPECQSSTTDQCIEKQSEWSNKYQQLSMRTLIARLNSATGQMPKGLIINGDLAELGTPRQLDTFKSKWQNFHSSITVYPGLGNHDYANNIDQCEHNHCVHRMLSYFTDYVETKLHRPVHMKNETGRISGSLSYSWDECVENRCFHFAQQNNYPNYTREIATNVTKWKIVASFDWLSNDLTKKSGIPVILNMHDFDTGHTEDAKLKLKSILHESPAHVVAIFFAHIHEKVGLRKPYFCLPNRDRPVWTIYSGSVPGNNYVLVHLSPSERSIKALYKVHVNNEAESLIELESLDGDCSKSGMRLGISKLWILILICIWVIG